MSVFKKQGVYWIDYYVDGHRKRERIGPDKRLAETVLRKRKVEIAEGKFMDKRRPVTTTFEELADAYWRWIWPTRLRGFPRANAHGGAVIDTPWGGCGGLFRRTAVDGHHARPGRQYRAWRRATVSRHHRPIRPPSTASWNA